MPDVEYEMSYKRQVFDMSNKISFVSIKISDSLYKTFHMLYKMFDLQCKIL